MMAPKIGTVYLWCGYSLFRVEDVDVKNGRVCIRQVGEAGNRREYFVHRSSSTEWQNFDHDVFNLAKTEIFACLINLLPRSEIIRISKSCPA